MCNTVGEMQKRGATAATTNTGVVHRARMFIQNAGRAKKAFKVTREVGTRYGWAATNANNFLETYEDTLARVENKELHIPDHTVLRWNSTILVLPKALISDENCARCVADVDAADRDIDSVAGCLCSSRALNRAGAKERKFYKMILSLSCLVTLT